MGGAALASVSFGAFGGERKGLGGTGGERLTDVGAEHGGSRAPHPSPQPEKAPQPAPVASPLARAAAGASTSGGRRPHFRRSRGGITSGGRRWRVGCCLRLTLVGTRRVGCGCGCCCSSHLISSSRLHSPRFADTRDLKMAAQSAPKVVLKSTTKMSLNER